MEIRGKLTTASNGTQNLLCIASETLEDTQRNVDILSSCGYASLVVQDMEKGGFVIIVNPTPEIIASAAAGLVSRDKKVAK